MKFAEDYLDGSVYEIGEHRVTAEEIVSFARQYDPQPYHLSEEEGQASPFGGLIASGWNTASIWMKLYVTNMLDGASVFGSPGVDELRWHAPVRPGDVLQGKVEVLGKSPSLTEPRILTIRKKGTLWRSGDDHPLCSLVIFSRFAKRAYAGDFGTYG